MGGRSQERYQHEHYKQLGSGAGPAAFLSLCLVYASLIVASASVRCVQKNTYSGRVQVSVTLIVLLEYQHEMMIFIIRQGLINVDITGAPN